MKTFPTSTCRSCGESIIWTTLPSGKKCPMDAEPINLALVPSPSTPCYDLEWDNQGKDVEATKWDRAEILESTQFYISHFSTCPQAQEHSKR